MQIHISALLVIISLLTGCAIQVPRDGDFETVKQIVEDRIDHDVYWYQGGEEDERVREVLDNLLAQPLTITSAVQIALLNNLDLQSEYENLGIAQADLVQAGLLSNPVLFGSVRFPKGGDGGNNIEFGIAKEFLEILLRPARERVAAVEFEKTRLRVVDAVLELAARVQSAYYQVQATQQLVELQKLNTEAADTSYELARKFDDAGNMRPRILAHERSAAAAMTASLLRANADLQSARDRLNVYLGIAGVGSDWVLAEQLPELPGQDPDRKSAIALALEQRLDLAVAEKQIEQLTESLTMTRDFRFIGGAEFGVSTERDPDGGRVTGPDFSVELPLFDQRQAKIARLESLLAQSRSRCEALRTGIRNEVQSAHNRVIAARTLSEYYRDELLPALEQVVEYTQQEQNYMLVDVFELLTVRRQQVEARKNYIEALADYWISRAELSRATGAGMPAIDHPDIARQLDTEDMDIHRVVAIKHTGTEQAGDTP